MEKPTFGPRFYQELAFDNPLGMYITERDVEAWWHYIAWPKYKIRRYKNHTRAVMSWWSRITVADLVRAREAAERAQLAEAMAVQEQMDAEYWAAVDAYGEPIELGALRVIMGGRK